MSKTELELTPALTEEIVCRVVRAGISAGKENIFDQLAWYLRYGFQGADAEYKKEMETTVKKAFCKFFATCGPTYQAFTDIARIDVALASRA